MISFFQIFLLTLSLHFLLQVLLTNAQIQFGPKPDYLKSCNFKFQKVHGACHQFKYNGVDCFPWNKTSCSKFVSGFYNCGDYKCSVN